jgi:hypothetical protein
MQLNMGRADQVMRGVFGASLILLAGLGAVDGAAKAVVVVVGSIAVFTASAGYCPLYRLLGRTSYRS